MEIKKLRQLINTHIGSENSLISYECKNLLSTGENYGSILLNIKIKLKNVHGEEETVNWVAKVAPPTEFLWNFFNISVTFKKEVGVYSVIGPTLNEYGREKGIDNLIEIFAGYHGSRVSLNPDTDIVDSDAVLLLENLKVDGYEAKDRFVGFDFDCTRLILRDLATIHAATIAFKLEKPEEFKTKIRPFLNRDFFFDTEEGQLLDYVDVLKSEAVAANPACAEFLPKLEERIKTLTKSYRSPLNSKEPFATFVHGDFWLNNILLKFENGIPIKHKMVDFQLIEYNSPANDVIFFLYSSVELLTLQDRVDEFLDMYFKFFIEVLKKLGCDVKQFTYRAFLDECAEMAWNLQFSHLLFMLIPMFTQKGKAKELTEWSTKDLAADRDSLHPVFGKRLQFILLDFVKRGWL